MSSQERFHALDAVRAFALLLGIVLHATMSFFLADTRAGRRAERHARRSVLRDPHVPDHHVLPGRGLVRAPGCSSAAARALRADRAKRILVPMLVGWVRLAPLTIGGCSGASGARSRPYVPAAAARRGPGGFPPVHLWFLDYLTVFYVLVLALRAAS